MFETFKKLILRTRNNFPDLFYKSNAMELGFFNNKLELSYNYIYDPKTLSIYHNENINNLSKEEKMFNIVLFYNTEFFNKDFLKNIITQVISKLDEQSMFLYYTSNDDDLTELNINFIKIPNKSYYFWIFKKGIDFDINIFNDI